MLNSGNNSKPFEERVSPGGLLLPSLIVSSSVVWIPSLLAGLLLIDIGQTFGYSVGFVGQMFTVSRIVGVISALVMGVLSIRFKHKSLLMTGLLFFIISALGCSLAKNFNVMLVSYSLSGLGMAIVWPMSMALVGEHIPLQKRVDAIGWINAGAALAGVIGGPIIGFIAGLGGWRLAFLVFVLPVSLLGLLLTAKGMPSLSHSPSSEMSKVDFLRGFKEVFSNRSAIACLVGYTLTLAAFTALGAYGPSFFRQRFLKSTAFVSMIQAGMNLCYALSSVVSGRLVNRFGRKPILVLTLSIASVLVVSFMNLYDLWLSLAIILLAYILAGTVFPASYSLTLEQVPRFRGTMMSINSAAENMGMAIGAGVGGLVLIMYNYEFVGISLGALGVVAALILQLLVTDPTRI